MSANPLLGTWRLKSYTVIAATGEQSAPFGGHPAGYLSYAADGRMQVIGTAGERVAPRGDDVAGAEQAALYNTMFAYAGRYSVEAGKVTHHVEVSWNESWNGTDQVRFYEVTGDTLTLTTGIVDPASGAVDRYVVVWEKAGGPR